MDANGEKIKILLEHLGTQYRLYREEARTYVGFAAASVSVLVVLFIGLLTLVKGNSKLVILIPLSGVSYGGLLALLYVYTSLAAKYSELIELKMNELLGPNVFQFENYYVGPKPGRREAIPFFIIFLSIGAMPIAVILFGLWRCAHANILSTYMAVLFLLIVVVALACVMRAVYSIINLRNEMNARLIEEWRMNCRTMQKIDNLKSPSCCDLHP